MNSSLNLPENARLLSEISAEESAAIAGGYNDVLFDRKSGVGVRFGKYGIYWSNGIGDDYLLEYGSTRPSPLQ
jgi:hypothetical protein